MHAIFHCVFYSIDFTGQVVLHSVDATIHLRNLTGKIGMVISHCSADGRRVCTVNFLINLCQICFCSVETVGIQSG